MTETQTTIVLVTHHTQTIGTGVAIQTHMVPPSITNTTVDNMDGATFTTIFHNVSPPFGGMEKSTTNLHGQDLVIVNHVTNFKAIDNVMDTMLEDVLGEGGNQFHRKVCSNQYQGTQRRTGKKKQGIALN